MLQDLVKWNKRMSAVYAAGIWMMIGTYAFFKYTGRIEDAPAAPIEEEPEDPNKKIYSSGHQKSIIIYKKDFVPYTTRLYNLMKAFTEEPGPEPRPGPGPEPRPGPELRPGGDK